MGESKQRLKIAFLTALTLQDTRSSWRITNRYMAHVLEKYCGDITYIDPIDIRELFIGKLINKGSQMLFKKGFMYYHSVYIARKFARLLAQRLEGQAFDIIFGPSCATEVAYLETDIPIVLTEDANVAALLNYYPQFSNLLKRSYYEANLVEGLGLKRASLSLYPSEWGSRSARENYQIEAGKVYTVPYGTNIDNPPPLEVVQRRKKSDRCKLFFIGVDWERKGGAIAFETLLKLEALGIQAELTICGCVPPSQFTHERMRVIPFLDKKIESQRREMESLFETSDFLFLPTRGEAYGMVFCEASSFGLPSITTNTGGVSGAVTEGVNGFMLPPEAGGAEYAELIARVYRDDRLYADLVQSSRAAYEERLNWDAWGKTVTALIHEMLERKNHVGIKQNPAVAMGTSGAI
ncbi:MAG TPA: glycosyltransferase family 4 protein [Ktedonobacteraceae bacterium]|nr:glycosyltransferase family 4 protein [Ktedonobacteraceae bacterium]